MAQIAPTAKSANVGFAPFAAPSWNARYLRTADGWSRRDAAVRDKPGPRLSPYFLTG